MLLFCKSFPVKNLIAVIIIISFSFLVSARDYYVKGRVTDTGGNSVQNARVSLTAGTTEYSAISNTDGEYSVRISGIYTDVSEILDVGVPFPNPFAYSVNIPVIISKSGELRLTIYNFHGKKIKDITFGSVEAGSYRVIWDGTGQGGAPEPPGLYFYGITCNSVIKSGRLIKAAGVSTYSASTALEPVMMPPVTPPSSGAFRFPVVSVITSDGYYPVRLTDITIARDTTLDFVLSPKHDIPFKTTGNHIAIYSDNTYKPMILKGINLGSSPPGYWPGEIAYAVAPELYEQWIQSMADAGFNSLRIYTLHPPVFYEKLAEYNQRHPEKPLLLFQGIWLEEVQDRYNTDEFDLIKRSTAFTRRIREVVDCIHGKGNIALRYGEAYGRYETDLSRWTAGYIIGREISPQEIYTTDQLYPDMTSFTGTNFSIAGGTASEVFITRMLDETVTYESNHYSVRRPVSISSWPTLDPLSHPTEIFTDEDKTSFDITKIVASGQGAGLFASYHAYPYYPNFISQQPSYRLYSDSYGPNSYFGYLIDLKSHYSDIPLVIAEFGVPSSWGSAHQSFSGMHHGGYSEQQQGEINMRLMHNIIDAGCGGGFMFAWMDEWFKPTWIVLYLEAYGIHSGGDLIPTRQLWHNITSSEQTFGLLTFDQEMTPANVTYLTDKPSGPVSKIEATHDNTFFLLTVETAENLQTGDTIMIAFDTYLRGMGESVLPNGSILDNRSEFLLTMVLSQDTAHYQVTRAYDMNGLTPRFDLSDHSVQRYRSTMTDGDPWILMQWINDEYTGTAHDIGLLPMENSTAFKPGQRSAVAWDGKRIKIRIPWTMLYFFDPTQMKVIDGAESYDGGYNYEILTTQSDGIAVSVYYDGIVTSTLGRYTWPKWLIVPSVVPREKKALEVVKNGLPSIPDFVE